MTNLQPAETGRLDRLPVWARDALTRLDRELTSTTEERDRLARIIGEPSGVGRDITALRVPERKYLNPNESWTDGLRVRFEGDGLLEVTGNGPLLIKTTASNMLEVTEAYGR